MTTRGSLRFLSLIARSSFVLAATEHLHKRISDRVRTLEGTLATLQFKHYDEPHPLLRDANMTQDNDDEGAAEKSDGTSMGTSAPSPYPSPPHWYSSSLCDTNILPGDTTFFIPQPYQFPLHSSRADPTSIGTQLPMVEYVELLWVEFNSTTNRTLLTATILKASFSHPRFSHSRLQSWPVSVWQQGILHWMKDGVRLCRILGFWMPLQALPVTARDVKTLWNYTSYVLCLMKKVRF